LKAWEAIMSSPIHRDENTDSALIYAPRWAREHIPSVAGNPLRSRAGTAAAAKMKTKRSKPIFSGDRAMLNLQRRLALNPNLIPEPLSEGAAVIQPLLIRLCSVGALAAAVAWGLVSHGSVKYTVEDVAASTAAIEGNHVKAVDAQPFGLRSTIAQAAETLTPIGKPRPVMVATAEPEAVTPAPVSVMAPASAETAAKPPAPPQRTGDRRPLLDSEEIAILIKRGRDLLADGDVAAARLLLRRAAEVGSAEAAFTLGMTFDPISLQRLGAIGAVSDLAQARQWYQRAAELGSSAASQQLAGLGDAR
jgi:hypothetical protein